MEGHGGERRNLRAQVTANHANDHREVVGEEALQGEGVQVVAVVAGHQVVLAEEDARRVVVGVGHLLRWAAAAVGHDETGRQLGQDALRPVVDLLHLQRGQLH